MNNTTMEYVTLEIEIRVRLEADNHYHLARINFGIFDDKPAQLDILEDTATPLDEEAITCIFQNITEICRQGRDKAEAKTKTEYELSPVTLHNTPTHLHEKDQELPCTID